MDIVGLTLLAATVVACASAPPAPKPAPGASLTLSLPIWPTAEQHSFADDRGYIVVVDAWASWCAPCKTELPQLDALARQWKSQGVRVYAVNIDTSGGTVQPFLMAYHVDLPILLDPGAGVLTQALGLKNMPTTWVFDKEGHRVLTEEGSLGRVPETVNGMLAQSAKP